MAEFLHERKDFKALIDTVAESEKIDDPALVEKDYWIMHCLYGLQSLGLTFELKGGTSLSKGFGVIHRFSEDIDIRIDPFDDLKVSCGPNHDKPAHVESRRAFFEALKNKLQIPGIKGIERDTEFDDEKLRNGALRLNYDTFYSSVPGLKDGVLLEVGFDQTSPHQGVTISSWVHKFASAKQLTFKDNRAPDVKCYNPEYTFVEKLQTVVKKFRQFKESGEIAKNFLRHYYDIHQLLDLEAVQSFIGTPDYFAHKKKRFKSENQNLVESGAFNFSDPELLKRFDAEYKRTEALYYRGQLPLTKIVSRIKADLERL